MVNNFTTKNVFETDNGIYDANSKEQALLVQSKLMTTLHLCVFFIGFMLFEYGHSRIKNADTTFIKHFLLFVSASLITFLLGFALAFGEPHLIGTKYFLSLKMMKSTLNPENTELLSLNYIIMILSMTITSTVSVSALNER